MKQHVTEKSSLKSAFHFLLLVIILISLAGFASAGQDYNVDKNSLALEGYDPVSYFTGKPLKGSKEYAERHQGVTYHFTSEKNKALFLASPQTYLPAYGGWCAWAMLDGEKIAVDPETFKIIDGVNYLFYNGFWGNTLKKWNELAAKKTETTLLTQANEHWLSVKAK